MEAESTQPVTMSPFVVPFGAAFRVQHCLHIVVTRDLLWLIGDVHEDEWADDQTHAVEKQSPAPRGLSVRVSASRCRTALSLSVRQMSSSSKFVCGTDVALL